MLASDGCAIHVMQRLQAITAIHVMQCLQVIAATEVMQTLANDSCNTSDAICLQVIAMTDVMQYLQVMDFKTGCGMAPQHDKVIVEIQIFCSK